MFSNAEEVLAYIRDQDVKFVDVRFCDLPGTMQHFNVPAESVDAAFFDESEGDQTLFLPAAGAPCLLRPPRPVCGRHAALV